MLTANVKLFDFLSADIKASAAPFIHVSSSGITGQVPASMTLTPNNDATTTLATAKLLISYGLKGVAKNGVLSFSVTEFSVSVTDTSADRPALVDQLDQRLQSHIDTHVRPQVAAMAEKGLALPALKYVAYAKPTIQLSDGLIYVGFDLKYRG